MILPKKTNKFLICVISIIMVSLILSPISIYAAAAKYTQSLKSGISNFPTDYQVALNKIKAEHPNWTFEAYNTGLSWDTLILNETSTHGRNRVIKSADASWRCSCVNVASGYACASKDIIAYYLDPRNFLNEINVFQFLEISYNSNIHNLAGVKAAVKNTFLDNTITYEKDGVKYTKTYSEIILEAAQQSKMSPYSIVTKIIQEVGTKGSSSVSGKYSGYEGYYNFFNLGAYDSGNAIVNGLKYARDKGWDNQYDAIIGGAKEVANGYTNAGQNTAYFYKWDVVGTSILQSGKTQTVSSSNMFWHQYMANVQDPTSQSKSLYNTYAKNGILEKGLNFIIPVYTNMPGIADMPTGFPENTENLYSVNCTDGLRVRSKASTSGSVLTTLYKNEKVQVITQNCTTTDNIVWDKIKTAGGINGYVADKYLTAYKNTTPTQTTVATAKTTDSLKMRKKPSTSGVLVTTIPKGKTVDILQKNAATANGYTWFKVKYGSNTGYVASQYLKDISDEKTEETSTQNTSGVTTEKIIQENNTTVEIAKTKSSVKLRKTAKTSGKVLTTIPKGKKVTIVKKNAAKKNGYKWHKVTYKNKTGYVASNYVSISSSNSNDSNSSKTMKTNSSVKLRKKAKTSGKVLTTIPKGKKVTIVKKNAAKKNGYTWHKVTYKNKTGYVVSKYLK